MDISFLRSALPRALPEYLRAQRWFGGKARTIESTAVVDVMRFADETPGVIALVRVAYRDKSSETYALPLIPARETGAARERSPRLELELPGGESARLILDDALGQREFCSRLLRAIVHGETMAGEHGRVMARPSRVLAQIWSPAQGDLDAAVLRGEQSNTSVSYGDRLILKFFRRVEPGVNPDLEVGLFLTEKTSFSNIPRTAGWLEFQTAGSEPAALASLQEFVPNQGDAWKYTLGAFGEYFERILAGDPSRAGLSFPSGSMLDPAERELPPEVQCWIGTYLSDAALLARRTAELHSALASDPSDPAFAPEPFTSAHCAALVRSMTGLLDRVFAMLRARIPQFVPEARAEAEKALRNQSGLRARFNSLRGASLDFQRVRVHGDYHLGQVLRATGDFVIIDFEGEPARPLAERRAKRSPLQDVAGMVRSFHYAASTGLAEFSGRQVSAPSNHAALNHFARLWYAWVSSVFLSVYFKASAGAVYLPRGREAGRLLLESFLLEKAVYELGYELNNRPGWVGLPLRGILELIGIE